MILCLYSISIGQSDSYTPNSWHWELKTTITCQFKYVFSPKWGVQVWSCVRRIQKQRIYWMGYLSICGIYVIYVLLHQIIRFSWPKLLCVSEVFKWLSSDGLCLHLLVRFSRVKNGKWNSVQRQETEAVARLCKLNLESPWLMRPVKSLSNTAE